MASSMKQLLDTVKEQCNQLDQRSPDYGDQVFETIAEIVMVERSHMTTPTNVFQQVSDKCEALGDLILREATRED